MKRFWQILAVWGLAAVSTAASADVGEVRPSKYAGEIGRRISDMLPKYHVSQRRLDDELSCRAWTNLVSFYDFDHSVFLAPDLERLARHERTIDDELAAGDVSFGFEVNRLYVERLRERIDFATNLLARGEWDFSADESYRIRRKDAPWPRTREEADEHWRKRMKNEVLAQILNRELDAEEEARRQAERPAETNAAEKAEADAAETNAAEKAETPESVLIKKYRQYATVMTEPDSETVLQYYLDAVTHAYDPHSDYMSPATKEDFDMDMNLTLCGVGAVLQMDDGALKIEEVMDGGPIDRDGRIVEGDRIVGVQQGDGEMEDVMWQPMRKTIRKIRGKKGTRVTLEIIPRSDPSGVSRKRVELVRDEIKLEDQAATGHVERVTMDGREYREGYIYLPGFYGTMDRRPNDPGYRSAALDVARLIADFNAADAEGLILDLRGNGGGSLREAVFLSALFVPQGPVVRIRDVRNIGDLPIPPGNPVAFRRPVVVMTDRASASASEIVAGHLQDSCRAVVVGDGRTHGKGTVQTVLGMGPERYGSAKLTTARFYRINGRSTQIEGVAADIRLPSVLDSLDVGEDKLTYALPFSRILPADYLPCWNLNRHVDALRRLSEARTAADERFAAHLGNVRGMKAIMDREEVPLGREARKRMMAADRALNESVDDDGDGEDGDDGEEDGKKRKKSRRRRNGPRENDVVLEEAYRILADLIRLNAGAEIPQPARGWWQ